MKCNLCNKTPTPHMKREGLSYSKCSCGLIFQDPMPTIEQLKEIYNNYYSKRETHKGVEFGYPDYSEQRSIQVMEKCYWKWLSKYIKGKTLDFGCGTGTLIELLKAKGYESHGIEFSESAFSVLNKKNIKFYKYKYMDLIKTGYDNVIMIDVFEHLLDPIGDLKKINSLMYDGGILLIETTNSDDAFAKYYKSNWNGLSPVHTYLWGIKTISAALEKTGFEIISIKTKKMTGGVLRMLFKKLRGDKFKWQFTLGDMILITARKVRE